MTRAEQIEKLIDAAFDVMHHDGADDGPGVIYERETLRKKFSTIFDDVSRPSALRGHEGQEHYGDGWETYRPEGYDK